MNLPLLAKLHSDSVARYRQGKRASGFFSPQETTFLREIGLTPAILFDYAEDAARGGEPSQDVFLQVAEIRMAFFLEGQEGRWQASQVAESDLPLREDEWQGIAWLPRIHQKALCFLEGTLCNEVMYGCSGDRAFLKRYALSLPTFLLRVREHGRDLPSVAEGFYPNASR